MDCEFEEKQYEQPLNSELGGRRRLLPIGQYEEHSIGIDGALFSRNPHFWLLWSRWGWLAPLFPPMSGVIVSPETWEMFRQDIDSPDCPVKFKFNVFIQHKRPEFVSSPLGKEYHFWNSEYFRYELVSDQQDNLRCLEEEVADKALVVYACPTFWRRRRLYELIKNGQLVQNSNFVRPSQLMNHRTYTFVAAGTKGRAFSESEEISSVDILREIDVLSEQNRSDESNSRYLSNLAEKIASVLEATNIEFQKTYQEAVDSFHIPDNRLAVNVRAILAFMLVTNIFWFIGYEIPSYQTRA